MDIGAVAMIMQKCLDGIESTRREIRGMSKHVEERFVHVEGRLDKMDGRLDRQDETLRMVWRQCGGSEDKRLPIDG